MKTNFTYDSSYDSEKKRYMQEAIEFILSKNYGDTIELNTLAKILHYNLAIEKDFNRFRSIMSRIKNYLIEKGYILKSISGIGYYILKPKQISSYCYRTYVKRTNNLLAKSDKILKHVDLSELTDIRKEELDNAHKLNTNATSVLWSTIQNSDYYKRKDYYDNLNDD